MNDDSEQIICGIMKAIGNNARLLKFNSNLIDLCRANENAHSRILSNFLRYKRNGSPLFLIHFLNALNGELSNGRHRLSTGTTPQIEIDQKEFEILDQHENIDVYIRSKNAAIIIENKIQWAADQYKQIERYIESAHKDVKDPNKIFVAYLTDDGRKKLTDSGEYSFTDEARKKLDYTDEENSGRLIPINYKEHILPLMEEFIGLIEYKDKSLISAFSQYIDHLKGRFGLRENEKEYYRKMNKDLYELLNLKEKNDGYENYKIITECQNKIWWHFEKLKEQVFPENWDITINKLSDMFSKKTNELKLSKVWIYSEGKQRTLVLEDFLKNGYAIDISCRQEENEISLSFFSRKYGHDHSKNDEFIETLKKDNTHHVLTGIGFKENSVADLLLAIDLKELFGEDYASTARNLYNRIESILMEIIEKLGGRTM